MAPGIASPGKPEHFSVQAKQLLSNNRVGGSFIPTQLLFP
jgi:hypothetical protein